MLKTYSSLLKFSLKKISVTLFLGLLATSVFTQINVVPNKANANYTSGETITFNVTSNSGGGPVDWEIKYDNNASPISSGTFNINPNQTKTVTFVANEPGVIICEVNRNGQAALAAAAVSPYDIQPFEQEPADFDAFWNSKKAALANVPMNASVSFLSNNAYSTSYRLTLDIINGRKMYGYMVVPNGSGPFPAVLNFPPFGDIPNLTVPEVDLCEKLGVIAISVGIHNVAPDQMDPNAYEPDNYNDKNGNYYQYAMLGGVRAIDYLMTRNDFDGTNIGTTGVSQGAGLAMIVGGLDNRVNLLMMSNPILCQNSGLHYDRAGGFPNYVLRSRNEVGTSTHEDATVDATRYYDAIFFAKRFSGTTLAFLSYEDMVTPAAGSFAAFNQLSGTKILLHSVNLGHVHPPDYFNGRYNFIRRFFPSTLTNHPFPFSPDNVGYQVNAGNDNNINGNSTTLSATVENEGNVNPNYTLKWEKISGPGSVSFDNANSYNTAVTFGASGTYVLQFSAIDESFLNSDQKYYSLFDRVTITTNGGGGGDTTPPTATLSANSNTVNTDFEVAVDFSENINGLELSDFEVINGTAFNLTGSGSFYTFTISPNVIGNITVLLPAFQVTDAAGNENEAPSNLLTVNYDPQVGTDTTPPTISLGTPSNNVTGAFVVDIDFSENINGLELSDFDLENGAGSNLTGSGSFYNITITPDTPGDVSVVIPSSRVTDDAGNFNEMASNILNINYQLQGGGGGDCSSPTNLALNKNTNQHSTQLGAFAGRANDGNTNGDFWVSNSVSLTNWANQAWWEIDLGEISDLKEIRIWNRSDCCSDILKNYHIFISEVPFASTDLNSTLNQAGVSNFFQSFEAGHPSSVGLNQTGRYVRIQLADQGFLALAEVEIMGCSSGVSTGGGDCSSPHNIAHNSTATQSSTQFDALAKKAIDGNTNGNFWQSDRSVSLTNWEESPWLEIDLGDVAEIDAIKIWNRSDCCSNVLSNFHVLVSKEPFATTDLNETLNQPGVWNYYQANEASFPSSVFVSGAGRYVRIQLAGQGFLSLAEVEVIGCFPNGTPLVDPNTLIAYPNALLSFTAEKTGRSVSLDWITQTEPLNDYFIIEKSHDAIHFETLAEVDSRSDTPSPVFYEEKDQIPFDGENFYRLKLILKDGTEILSAIQRVEFNGNVNNITLYPNPAKDQISVHLQPFIGENVLIQIYDTRGVLIHKKDITPIQEAVQTIDLENFKNGLFNMLIFVNGKNKVTKSFVVERLH